MNDTCHTPENHSPVSYSIADNSVRVEPAFLSACTPLTAIETICRVLADADPVHNPCGLFCHPQTEAETTLVLGTDIMLHQDALARLIEELYLSCNYPLHIRVETTASEPLISSLTEQVLRHLKGQSEGGYIDEDRATSSWEWRCYTGDKLRSAALDSYRAMGGSVMLLNS